MALDEQARERFIRRVANMKVSAFFLIAAAGFFVIYFDDTTGRLYWMTRLTAIGFALPGIWLWLRSRSLQRGFSGHVGNDDEMHGE